MLTDAKVQRAKAANKTYRLRDGGGLFLYVSKSGIKSWRYHYEWKNRNQSLTLGHFPALDSEGARALRRWARQQLAEGRNPSEVKKMDAVSKGYGNGISFEEVAREWFAAKKQEWVEEHAADVIEGLETHVFPHTSTAPIGELKAPLFLGIVKRIEARPAPEIAKRIRQRISVIFDFAIATGRAETNPAAALGKLLSPRAKGHLPSLRTLDECREMLAAIEKVPAFPVTRLAMRFLALTAVRPGVVLGLPWIEVEYLDDVFPVWTVPAARMKLRKHYKAVEERSHKVPLSRQALEILCVAYQLTKHTPFVFPNDRLKYKPMSENALGYLLNRAGYYRRHVAHGWRASFSTIMNERHPDRSKIIDKMLAHQGDDEVEAAYNRSEHLELRRQIAQEWADILLEGFAPADSLLLTPALQKKRVWSSPTLQRRRSTNDAFGC